MNQYQDGWERRLRELRDLGWVIQNHVLRSSRPHISEYRLIHWEPWPKGRIKAAIEERKKTK